MHHFLVMVNKYFFVGNKILSLLIKKNWNRTIGLGDMTMYAYDLWPRFDQLGVNLEPNLIKKRLFVLVMTICVQNFSPIGPVIPEIAFWPLTSLGSTCDLSLLNNGWG